MSERQEGWYWVKTSNSEHPEHWECSYHDHNGFHEPGVVIVGPRIPSPDEPWQCVPVDPNWDMLAADGCSKHHEGQECLHHENRKRIWQAMLAAAAMADT